MSLRFTPLVNAGAQWVSEPTVDAFTLGPRTSIRGAKEPRSPNAPNFEELRNSDGQSGTAALTVPSVLASRYPTHAPQRPLMRVGAHPVVHSLAESGAGWPSFACRRHGPLAGAY